MPAGAFTQARAARALQVIQGRRNSMLRISFRRDIAQINWSFDAFALAFSGLCDPMNSAQATVPDGEPQRANSMDQQRSANLVKDVTRKQQNVVTLLDEG